MFVPTHKHYKGGLYKVLHYAYREAEYPKRDVVYQGEDGTVWTRTEEDFRHVFPNGTRRFQEIVHEPSKPSKTKKW